MNEKIPLILTLFIFTIFLSGCSNTWDGAGKDLSGAGQWLEETF